MNNDIKQLIVLDSIRDRLEMIQSDILPGSCVHPVRSGDGNTPTAIRSLDGTSYAVQNTYFPLYPLEGDVHYLKDSFLHFVIDVSFQIVVKTTTLEPIRLYVGPRDTASIFNQIELCLDNMAFLPSVYHHLESAIQMTALPASVIDHSPDYATIDKLLHDKKTPMHLIEIPAATRDGNSNPSVYTYYLSYDLSIDLNQLCVPLSNIDYITKHMGNLRLNVYLNNFQQSFYYFVCPSSSNQFEANQIQLSSQTISYENGNGLLMLAPIDWGTCSTTDTNTNAVMTAPTWIPVSVNRMMTLTEGTPNTITFETIQNLAIPIQFVLHMNQIGTTTNTTPFMQVRLAEICQTCFSLEASSVAALDEYFATQQKIIIPIQRFSTVTFDSGTVDGTRGISRTLTANVPGKNITTFIASLVPLNCQSCLLNPYMMNYQAILNGRPLNGIIYQKTNARAIKDYADACIDTDEDELNGDFLASLEFPPLITGGETTLQTAPKRNANEYFYTFGTDSSGNNLYDFTIFKKMKERYGIDGNFIKMPFNFMHVWSTAIPDSFHTGYCIAETAPSLSQFRLDNTATTIEPNDGNYSRFTIQSTQGVQTGRFTAQNEPYMTIPSYTNRTCMYYLTALCDACIVLSYDAGSRMATSAAVADVAPFLTD